MPTQLSIVVIAKNEELNLKQTLPSYQFADEIVVVVDPASTDRTAEVAEQLGAKIVFQSWLGFSAQKNFALAQATGDWLLSLDADEEVTESAKAAIRQAISRHQFDSYYLPRLPYFLGRPIKHSGWYPDWQLRLFKRGSTEFDGSLVHERVKPTSQTQRLEGAIINHYTYRSLASYFARLAKYTSLEAKQKAEHLSLVGWLKIFIKPPYQLLDMYLFKLGFLDGLAGLLIALLSSYYSLVVLTKVITHKLGFKL